MLTEELAFFLVRKGKSWEMFNQENVIISFAQQKVPYTCLGAVARESGVERQIEETKYFILARTPDEQKLV